MTFKQIFRALIKKPADFTRIDFSKPENKLTYKKAINIKCLDCMCGLMKEVRECTVTSCALYPFKKSYPTGKDEVEKDTKQISSEKPKRKYHFKKKNDTL